MDGISVWQLLIIAIIVVLLFGTDKLRTLGADLGSSIRDFKKAMNEDDDKQKEKSDIFNEQIIIDKSKNKFNNTKTNKDE
ncbi:twin-arginine translocase subunit TatA [Candidatus Pantoea edessiphila]|uniref:Sec-independent protein translocase protein TatA n=1 Tax=Candidatus Pantoea edessiphila TaxID=2044610 RepID=A0A2P5T1C7_9GAMM|nr:twin-arginine translocase TatA/TatE family subunit [Candidatus Pantoea edessiphila]PPI88366.1 twin-arginine translocase subunit TatA [Candidatus Pantoea edessiphila]